MVTTWIDSDDLAKDGFCTRVHVEAELHNLGFTIIRVWTDKPHTEYSIKQLSQTDQARIYADLRETHAEWLEANEWIRRRA